jgi:hypothetical protein
LSRVVNAWAGQPVARGAASKTDPLDGVGMNAVDFRIFPVTIALWFSPGLGAVLGDYHGEEEGSKEGCEEDGPQEATPSRY